MTQDLRKLRRKEIQNATLGKKKSARSRENEREETTNRNARERKKNELKEKESKQSRDVLKKKEFRKNKNS